MISVVYCTRVSNPSHIEHIKKTCGIPNIEVIEYVNSGESLTKVYNKLLDSTKNDIVVFCHDDIDILTKNWGEKLIKHYKRNPEYGILGVAGSKELPASGKWWENRRKMYGQVSHTNNGKTWLSVYSKSQGKNLDQTVIVDGVFFSVKKSIIKKSFNEDVKGFHFYDVDFCFRNHLENVKIGVHYDIKINHKSIGQTNDEWEKNRVKFSEYYKDNLPVNLPKIFRKGEKIKVLIACLNFNSYTGSELHVYDLAKELIKQNCDVTICSNIGGEISTKAKACGIKLVHNSEPPHYKLGDGKWDVNTQNGIAKSVKGVLYPISEPNFDVLHLMHKPITEYFLKLYPNINTICTIHSEVIDLEFPVINPQIKKYIAIREEIKNFIVEDFNINPDIIDVIYNPIDTNKFKVVMDSKHDKKRILFVGTMDYLRKNTIEDLIITTRDNGHDLWLVGKNNGIDLDSMINNEEHVTYFEPTYDIEKFVQQCDETAGILLGRTTIESWLCGKPAWIYNIDKIGNIIDKNLHQPPNNLDMFKCENVVKLTIDKYKEII